MGFHAVEREIDAASGIWNRVKGQFAIADDKRCRTLAIVQADLLLGPVPLAESEHPLPPADRHPARRSPWGLRLGLRRFRLFAEDRSNGRAKFKIVRRRWR